MASSFNERFLSFAHDHQFFRPGGKTLIAVSGGIDSVVLTYLFKSAGIPFAIAHCNYGLRGEESENDEKFVRQLATKFECAIHVKKFNTKKIAAKNKKSIQETARELRYEWFEEIRKQHHYDAIATAHHLDDSIETFFINMIRGTGLAGLKGIPVRRGKVIRPLLFSKRSEIESYAKRHRIRYCIDSSNAKDDYLRNSIRHHFLPLFKDNEENFERKMREAMDYFSFIDQLINEGIQLWRNVHVVSSEREHTIPLKKIREENDPVRFLSLLLYSFGIPNAQADKILSSQSAGKDFRFEKHRLLFDSDKLILQELSEVNAAIMEIDHLPAEISVGDHRYLFTSLNAEKLDRIPKDPSLQVVDAGKLSFPLTIRRWKSGDSFQPFGMKGRKKLSDYFIDKKINRFEKEKMYVLLSGQNIVTILGHRIDDRYKVSQETHSILQIKQQSE
ncbi:MAG: tRNA lysidine(34) synthetase TilS [Bacteroidia bacterium]